MDIKRKLAVTVAAMVLAGQMGATLSATAATRTQLRALQDYLTANDLAGLTQYVSANPELMEPNRPEEQPLASVLVEFMTQCRPEDRLAAFVPPLFGNCQGDLPDAIQIAMY